jgi:hypothetical protein
MLAWPSKDPDELLDYEIDWSARLVTDTIVASVFTIPTGTVVNVSQSLSATTTTIWLSGGADGETCEVLNQITTAGGRIMDQTVRLRIRSR